MSSETNSFETIRQTDEADNEYWRSRDLAKILEYGDYRNFLKVIDKAKKACENSDQPVADHFVDVTDMIEVGKGARRRVKDVHLSRYACYLIIQNADPEKEVVALGQTYFAVTVRRQEESDELAGLSETQRRLFLRDQLTGHNKQLADTAKGAGVITSFDFAIFQDHGYSGLYAGETARDIHTRKGLKPNQKILDHMGSTELAANLFRSTQTDEKIRRERIKGKEAANQAHREVGEKVRQTIKEIGGTMPEELPTPKDSIQEIGAKEKKKALRGPQMSMFGEDEETGEN